MALPRRFLVNCSVVTLVSSLFLLAAPALPARAEEAAETVPPALELAAPAQEDLQQEEVVTSDGAAQVPPSTAETVAEAPQESDAADEGAVEPSDVVADSPEADPTAGDVESQNPQEDTPASSEEEAVAPGEMPQAAEATASGTENATDETVATEAKDDLAAVPATSTADGEEETLEESATILHGVDISGHNTGINYNKLGDFVIIKATEWNPNTNTYTSYNNYKAQADAALAAGKLIGFYHFVTSPIAANYSKSSVQTMKQQAQGFIDAVKPYLGKAMLFLDWENGEGTSGYYSVIHGSGTINGKTVTVSASQEVGWAKEWLDYVLEKTKVRPAIYMNKSYTNQTDWTKVVNSGYELWGAMYLYKNMGKTDFMSNPDYTPYGSWGAWGTRPLIYQYASDTVLHTGKEYDVNCFYGSKDDWINRVGVVEVETSMAAAAKILTNGTVYAFSPTTGDVLNIASYNGNVQLGKENYITAYWRVENLNDGTYRFYNLNDGKALAVAANPTAGKTAKAKSASSDLTLWTLIKCSNGEIAFVPYGYSKLRLDISGGKLYQDQRNIQVYTANGTASQRFFFTKMAALTQAYAAGKALSEGIYAIESKADASKAIDVKGGSTANGANIQLYASNGSFAQRYRFAYAGNGLYHITVVGSDKRVDVAAGSTANGANIQQYAANATLAQMWYPKKVGAYYTLVSAASDRVFDLAAGKTANGTNVRIYSSNGSDAQKFKLVEDKPLETAISIGKVVGEGVYSFFSALKSDAAVDVASGSKANGANVRVWNSNGSVAQKYDVSYFGKGLYIIRMAHSGKVLDVKGGSKASGANVQQYQQNGSRAQLWYFVKDGSGYRICSSLTGHALTVDGSSASNGTNISVRTQTGSNAQTFTVKKTGAVTNGTYTVTSAAAKVRLDVKNGSTKAGANVQVWTSNNSKAQRWVFTYLNDGTYKITSALSGLALEVRGGSKASGANVQQGTYTGAASQRWVVRVSKTGALLLQNVGSGLVVDIAGGKAVAGTNVQQYANNGTATQTFVIGKS